MTEQENRKRKRAEGNEAINEDAGSERTGKASGGTTGINFVKAERQYLYDTENVRYLDTKNAAQIVGHCHEKVLEVAGRQMAELNTNTRFLNDRMILYCQRLTATLPPSLTKCIFVNSRSEANDLALRIATVVTGHSHSISLAKCYHGHLQSLRVLQGDYPSTDWSQAPQPDVYRGEYRGDPGEWYAAKVQEIIDTQSGKISCFMHESVMTNTGMSSLPPGFLSAVYRSVRKAGGICIADEAETGFGRLGEKFWGFECHGVCPEIVTLGEAMGNGHPVSAVIMTNDVAENFAKGCSYFNTYGGNPVSMAIANTVLEVVKEEGLQENARVVGQYLMDQLRQLQERHNCIGDVRGSGLCVGIELVTDRKTKDPAVEIAKDVITRLEREYSVLAERDQVCGNVIKVKPPLCFTTTNAKELVTSLDAVLLAHTAAR